MTSDEKEIMSQHLECYRSDITSVSPIPEMDAWHVELADGTAQLVTALELTKKGLLFQ